MGADTPEPRANLWLLISNLLPLGLLTFAFILTISPSHPLPDWTLPLALALAVLLILAGTLRRSISSRHPDNSTTSSQILGDEQQDDQSRQTAQALAESLRRVGLALSATLDLKDLLDMICQETIQLFNVEAAFVWLVRDEHVIGFAGYGQGRNEFLGLELPLSDPDLLGARVIRQRKPIMVNDALNAANIHRGLVEQFKVKALLGVPLMVKDRVIGALMILDSKHTDCFGPDEVKRAQVLASHAAVAIDNAQLFEGVERSRHQLEEAYDSTLEGWSRALELRDHETEGHTRRVAEMTAQLAEISGLSGTDLKHIRRGALLHDIGKIGIPDSILLKPGPLDDDEWTIMKRHPIYGKELIEQIEYLQPAMDIPYYHHEKWDGSGYPQGLAGEAIPWAARLFAVVDVYDALICDRPYRKAWPRQKVLEHIRQSSGSHFDPSAASLFLDNYSSLLQAVIASGGQLAPCERSASSQKAPAIANS